MKRAHILTRLRKDMGLNSSVLAHRSDVPSKKHSIVSLVLTVITKMAGHDHQAVETSPPLRILAVAERPFGSDNGLVDHVMQPKTQGLRSVRRQIHIVTDVPNLIEIIKHTITLPTGMSGNIGGISCLTPWLNTRIYHPVCKVQAGRVNDTALRGHRMHLSPQANLWNLQQNHLGLLNHCWMQCLSGLRRGKRVLTRSDVSG